MEVTVKTNAGVKMKVVVKTVRSGTPRKINKRAESWV